MRFTESSRLVRGARTAAGEYISESRTEIIVGCDGTCTRYRARVSRKECAVLDKAGSVSCL